MARRLLAFVAGLALALGLGATLSVLAPMRVLAQSRPDTIDPGMTHDQVVTRLGAPEEERVSGSYDYMYYENQCGQKCGIDDLVILEKGIVTDAVFRSKTRVFTGVSSSPHDLPPSPPTHMGAVPIRASTAEDSANRGGIVFAPRTDAPYAKYDRVVPNHADSARMVSPNPGAPSAPVAAPPAADSSGVAGAVHPNTAAPH
jgi:hypothetical protein